MNTFIEDFRSAWNKPNNTLIRLIIINVFLFVVINLIYFFGNSLFLNNYIINNLAVPSAIDQLIFRPWTLFTYFFTHEDLMHILYNMLCLYWFGIILNDFLNGKKLLALYILGGLAGALSYIFIYNVLPYFAGANAHMIGASASVYAIVVGAATLAPDYRIFLIFIGPVKIKYVALVYVFLSFISTTGSNAGGNIAHLGGALLGFLFVTQLKKGNDWSKPVTNITQFFEDLFNKKNHLKVIRRRKASTKKTPTRNKKTPNDNQETVDAILDKISESGYEKLSAEEKQILFEASQRKGS